MTGKMVEILLVEDNPSDVELTLHALKKNNLANRIQVFADGAEALDFMFRRGRFADRVTRNPRVVLLDLKLPKIDGFDVLRQLKASPDTAAIPVVILTSSREERDFARGYAERANSFIVKPVDWEQFTTAVREIGLYWLLLNQAPSPAAGAPTEAPKRA